MHQQIIEQINPFYLRIITEYSNSVELEETIHFLDLAFPKWKTNGGLGAFALEFVIWILDHSSESYQNNSFFEFLKFVYFEIAEEYSKYEESQAFSFDLECIEDFPQDSESFYEALTDKEYKVEFEKYKSTRREENAFDFTF